MLGRAAVVEDQEQGDDYRDDGRDNRSANGGFRYFMFSVCHLHCLFPLSYGA